MFATTGLPCKSIRLREIGSVTFCSTPSTSHLTIMFSTTSSRILRSTTEHCTFCGSRLQFAPTAARQLFSSQAVPSSSAGRHLPRWQSTNRSQRAAFSSILQHDRTSIHAMSPVASGLSQLARGRRPYATIIDVPTIAEDDLPEPLIKPGQGDANSTLNVTPSAEKVGFPRTLSPRPCLN